LLLSVLDILTTPNALDEECRLGDLDTKVDTTRKCSSIELSRATFTIAVHFRFQIVPSIRFSQVNTYPSPGFKFTFLRVIL
jgi:hypothetical protein